MSRQADCGPAETRARVKIARKHLEMAELAQTECVAEAKNVAAAITLLRTIHPDGRKLADALTTVLAIKDPAHYGIAFVTDAKLRATLRAASQLVEAAELIAAAG